MIKSLLLGLFGLLVLAAILWAVVLVLRAVFARLSIPEDIKTAAIAVITVVLFIVALAFILNTLGVLPAGWW